MSDKYYLHDYNSYIYGCQNTYRIEANEVTLYSSVKDIVAEKAKQGNWWQRLLKPQKLVKSQ